MTRSLHTYLPTWALPLRLLRAQRLFATAVLSLPPRRLHLTTTSC